MDSERPRAYSNPDTPLQAQYKNLQRPAIRPSLYRETLVMRATDKTAVLARGRFLFERAK